MKSQTIVSAAAAATATLTATPALAAEMNITINIPRIETAEYHSPYIAVWIEQPDQTAVATVAVWYAVDRRFNGGLNWVADMRTWWRKTGRTLTLPADGISGATRPPGAHTLTLAANNPALRALAPGQYTIAVEAAREGGGHEVVRVPFEWNGQAQAATAQGQTELGQVRVAITP